MVRGPLLRAERERHASVNIHAALVMEQVFRPMHTLRK